MPQDNNQSAPRRGLDLKRSSRWQLVNEVQHKIDRVRLGEGGSAEGENRLRQQSNSSNSTTSSSNSHEKGSWFKKYHKNRDEAWGAYIEEEEGRLRDQRSYRVHITEFQDTFPRSPPPPMVPWQRHVWPRNFYCELCLGVAGPGADVLDCRSCDVVMHYRCVMKKYGSINMNPRTWHCEFCSGTFELEKIQYDEDKKAYRMALIHFRMAVRLQATARAWLCHTRYIKFLKNLSKAQAMVRRFIAYRKFRVILKHIIRLYKIKIVELTDLSPLEKDPPSNTLSLFVSVVQWKFRHALVPKDFSYIDAEKQIYRFETANFHHNTNRINQQFLVPGSTNQVLIVLTVVRKEGVHNEFWGQTIMAGPEVLDKKNKFRLNLGELKFEPRDKKNSVPLRNRVLEDSDITGQITVEIQPLFNFNSKCSMINEIPDLGKDDARNVLRTWWACLVESTLLLFKKYGDVVPYRTLVVLRVTWYNTSVIRVASVRGDEAMLFTCPEPDRTDWYNKLRAVVSDKTVT